MTEFGYMKPSEKLELRQDLISRKEAGRILKEGGTIDQVPQFLPVDCEIITRSDMSDLLCLGDDGFWFSDLKALLEFAKEKEAVRHWQEINKDENGFTREVLVETMAGDMFVIEWWKNVMYLRIGFGVKVDFHNIELGHENCGSFGAWTFWFSRFARPYMGRGMFCGSIRCETPEQFTSRMEREKERKKS